MQHDASRPRTPIRIGVDLGTSHSLAAVLRDGQATVIRNQLGEVLTPSAVAVDDAGQILVGAAAKARKARAPTRAATNFKRDMGRDVRINVGDRAMRPEELSALVLRHIREDVEAATGCEVVEAVVTVPAYFGEAQRRATRTACELAGLHVERIINEPTAAALAYGLREREAEITAVVLDLGGGTFDITILELTEGIIEIQSTAGDARLGGEDFLDIVVQLAMARLERMHGRALTLNAHESAELRDACERAKHQLSEHDRAKVTLACRELEIELERSAIESAWEPLLARMTGPVRRAMSDAGLTAEDIGEVLLVGGATRMPVVSRLASRLFGRLPNRSLPPDEAVAMGAAMQVAIKADDAQVEDFVVTDIAPFSLGVETVHDVGLKRIDGVYSPILSRGTVLPASRLNIYSTAADGQTEISLQIYQGEHAQCAHNQYLGKLEIEGIAPAPEGRESVEVRFTYDLNGLLEVDATLRSSKKTVSGVFGQAAETMTPAQIAAAQAAMKNLKFHPRDALPNTTALERAEALYSQLLGEMRDVLGMHIASFRATMEGQDSRDIATARERLMAMVDALSSHRE